MADIPDILFLREWYEMEEDGGNAYCSHSGGYLAEIGGTITRGVGKIGYCRNFEADDTHYLKGGVVGMSDGDCTTIGLWIKPESIGSTMDILWQDELFKLQITSDGLLELSVYDGSWHTAQYPTTILPATWYFVTIVFDGISIFGSGYVLVSLKVNDDTAVATSATVGMYGHLEGSGVMHIGANDTPDNHFDGKMDELFIFHQYITTSPTAMSDTELVWLYNDGDGRSYNDLKSGGFMAIF